MPLDGDMVVGVHRVLAPLRALPAPVRQGPHVGEIDALETAVPRLAGAVGIGPVVDLPDPGGDRAVQRRQIMEDMVAQRRQDPTLNVKHSLFDESLVARAPDPRRQALDAVMFEQIGIGLVQDRLVARRLCHRRLDVVRNHQPRRPAHVLEAAHVRGAPVLNLLGQRRLGVEPPRHPHRGHEHLRLVLDPLDQEWSRHAGVIDEQTLAGTAVLAHRHVSARPPFPEPAAPGRIAHPVGMRLAPFLPQQHQRHATAGQVFLDLRPVHLRPIRSPGYPIERRLQDLLVQVAGLQPAQPGGGEPLQGLRHRAPCKTAVGRDGAGAAALVEMKRKNLLHLSHRQPSPCHRIPLGQFAKIRDVGRHTESNQNPPPRRGGYFGENRWLLCLILGGYFREIRQEPANFAIYVN